MSQLLCNLTQPLICLKLLCISCRSLDLDIQVKVILLVIHHMPHVLLPLQRFLQLSDQRLLCLLVAQSVELVEDCLGDVLQFVLLVEDVLKEDGLQPQNAV